MKNNKNAQFKTKQSKKHGSPEISGSKILQVLIVGSSDGANQFLGRQKRTSDSANQLLGVQK